MPPTTAYLIGDIVYLRVATERSPGMVTGILQRPSHIQYLVTWETCEETHHFACELTDEFEPFLG
jgi:hypothetical protein